ncbi:hypothetical protein [Turicimonas sp. TL08]
MSKEGLPTHVITDAQFKVLIKMASFQSKIMAHIPPEVREKAFKDAIQSGELKIEEVPTPEELTSLNESLGWFTSSTPN